MSSDDVTPATPDDNTATPATPPSAPPVYSNAEQPPAAPPRVGPRPLLVTVSFWLYIASAALSLGSGIIALVNLPGERPALIAKLNEDPSAFHGHSVSQIADLTMAAAAGLIIATMLFWAIVFVLFALFMRSGRNWARIVLTILTILSLLNIFSIAGLTQLVASAIALILLWLPASRTWFAEWKASRLPRV